MSSTPAASSVRRTLWLIGFAFVLHELEEWNLVSWLEANFEPAPAFTDRAVRTLLVLFAALGLSFTALAIRLLSLRSALLVLLPLFLVVFLGNALTHVVWLFSFGAYAPGVLTSALLMIPLTLHLARVVLRERLAPAAYVWALLMLALLQPAGAMAMGNTMSAQQIALQRFGARLAEWLWVGG